MRKWGWVVLLLFLAGNVYQWLNPRVEIKTEIKTEVKWKTKVAEDVETVKVTKPDGTITETTKKKIRTETDKDLFTENKTESKPVPLPLNTIYLGINPAATTDLEIIYARRVFGPIKAYASGSVDLTEFKPKAHLGLGVTF